MIVKALVSLAILSALLIGCSKPTETAPQTTSVAPQGGSGTVATADVGAVSPATGVSLDSAAGGGVNSAAMKKAKGIAAGGVGSMNSAQKSGDDPTTDGG